VLDKYIALFVILFVSVSVTPAFALTDLERASIADPKIVNAFGSSIGNNVNVDQQIQISADITNNQKRSQNFVYLIQIKNDADFVVSLGWISGQLTPDQRLTPSLSWTPNNSGKYTAEIFVWGGLKNHNALSEYTKLQISVS